MSKPCVAGFIKSTAEMKAEAERGSQSVTNEIIRLGGVYAVSKTKSECPLCDLAELNKSEHW